MKVPNVFLFLSCSLAAFSYAFYVLPAGRPEAPRGRPNILWITCEDLSPQHFGCYGGKVAQTPNVDQLAREGVLYTNVFSTAGVCAPSRNALITGMYQTSAGGHHMRTLIPNIPNFQSGSPVPSYSVLLPEEVRCYPEILRAAGYYCTNNVKQDYQFEAPPTFWDENSPKADWRGRKSEDQPFFAIINLEETHESQVFSRDHEPLTVDPAQVSLPPFYQDTEVMRRDMARFLTNVEIMDRRVGEILQRLKDDGLYDNTLIFFYSDHGDGLPFTKRELYDRGLKVPFIIRFPKGENAGTVDRQLVSFVDLAPTVLSLAGLPIPRYMQGQAFLGSRKAKTPRRYIFAARDRVDAETDRVRAVSDGRFKYFRNYMPEKPYYQDLRYRKQQKGMAELLRLRDEGRLNEQQMHWFRPNKPQEELFDVQNDPHEMHNLAADPAYRAKLEELRNQHLLWLKKYGDLGEIPEKEMLAKWWNGKDHAPQTEKPLIQIKGGKATISCPTKGASLGYKNHTADPSWKIYTRPVSLAKGDSLMVVAHRIGYKPSEMVKAVVQ